MYGLCERAVSVLYRKRPPTALSECRVCEKTRVSNACRVLELEGRAIYIFIADDSVDSLHERSEIALW